MSWKFFTNSGQQKTFDSSVASSVSTVASASSIAVTGPGTYLLTGTTTVATITGGAVGMTITVQASAQASGTPVVLTYGTGSNAIKLTGGRSLGLYAQVPADTAAGAGESVTLRYDGTAWVEIARDLRTVLGYTEITSNKNVTSTSAAAGTSVVAAPAITFDGATLIDITFYAHLVDRGTTYCRLMTYDGSTAMNEMWRTTSTVSPATCVVRLTPTAASHTYGIYGYVDAGTGIVYCGALNGGGASSGPAYIKVSRSI